MKTREEFVLLTEAYRKESRTRAFLMLPFIIVAIISVVLVAGLMGRYLGHHSPLIGVWIILFFLTLLGLNFYQARSQESMARKFGLCCPTCSRVLLTDDLKLAISTHNCPYCGAPLFS